MKIGSLKLTNNTVLAPLAGITNLPFRLLIKAGGCGLVYSEMVSSNGIDNHCRKTLRMMESVAEEKPLSIQIFGSNPAVMARAARIVESSGADAVDINFGCSVKKVLKIGAGAALMKSPDLAESILKAVRDAVDIPVTIKIRTGWSPSGDQAFVIAEIAQSCGVNAIAIHSRTAPQGFRGNADWRIIAALKQRASIPVIGNGDIVTPEDATKMIRETGCDAVMIGRAAIGNPWIFSQVQAHSRGDEVIPATKQERIAAMETYLKTSVEHFGETTACYLMRGRLGWLAKGLPMSRNFRRAVSMVSSEPEALKIITAYSKAIDQFPEENSL